MIEKSKVKSQKSKVGFTLIELLIVIAILGILAVTLLAIFNPLAQMQKARDSRRKTDLREIKTSLMLYHNICDSYPQSNVSKQIVGCGTDCGSVEACSWDQPWNVGSTTIMKILPKAPSGQDYNYTYIPEDNSFRLVGYLERKDDPAGRDSQARCNWSDGDNLTNEYVVCED